MLLSELLCLNIKYYFQVKYTSKHSILNNNNIIHFGQLSNPMEVVNILKFCDNFNDNYRINGTLQ